MPLGEAKMPGQITDEGQIQKIVFDFLAGKIEFDGCIEFQVTIR